MQVRCKHDVLFPVEKLLRIKHPKNANKHPDDQIKRLAKIMAYQGVRHPITISKLSGFITKGHGRLAAAIENGWTEFPVEYQEYDDLDMEVADLHADNAIASWAEFDIDFLKGQLPDFKEGFDFDVLGLRDLGLEKEGECDADEVPDTRPTTIAMGALFSLGNHRLLCGDSTKAEDVSRLMNGEKADIFLTDPPYGVSYTDKNEYLNSIGKAMACPNAIENDHLTIDETGKVWLAAYQNAIAHSSDRASFYIFSPQGGDLMMMMMIDKAGWTLKHMLVWVKNNHVLGRCDYHYKHEPIFYGWNKVHDFYGGSSCFSVFEFDKPLKNDLHPTMKPVELLENLVANSSVEGGKVLDLFLGSGSTLIACEKTGRKCYGSEIDPSYCQVIVDRWEKFTGQKAEKL